MPNILKEIAVQRIKGADVYIYSLQALETIGAREIKKNVMSESPFSAEASGIIPSIWGWGEMQVTVNINESDGLSKLRVGGYIAQGWTGPLTSKLKEFLTALAGFLEKEFSYKLEYTNEFSSKMEWGKEGKDKGRDSSLIMIITITTLLECLAGLFFGHWIEFGFVLLFLVLGYRFIKNFYKSR